MHRDKEIDWAHPDIDVRMRVVMRERDEDGNRPCAIQIEVRNKNGELISPIDLTREELTILAMADEHFYSLLEEASEAAKASEDFADALGFKKNDE